MIVPIRCKSCGKPIGHLYADYKDRIKKEDANLVLTDLGVQRYCCRAQLLSHVELVDIAAQFKKF